MTARRTRRWDLVVLVAGVLGAVGFVVPTALSAPAVAEPTISAGPSGPTASTTAAFSFSGPRNATFRCSLDGGPFATCTSPRTYSGLGQGAHTFGVRAVVGGAESASTTRSWTVDTVAPDAPTLTTKPSDPTPSATNDFAWSQPEPGATYQCALENGAWTACTTPYRWVIDTDNYGQHQFSVRAVDSAGNVSVGTAYRFKYEKKLPDSGVPFTIGGSVEDLTIGVWRPIQLRLTNPNSVPIFVSNVTVTLPDVAPQGCGIRGNFEVEQSDISMSRTVTVPAGGHVTLPTQGVTTPRLRLKNLPINQDVCKGVSFQLGYSGTATN